MRIIAGEYRGQHIKAPSGKVTRPTTDRVRESVFNILQHTVEKQHVLDLYAGSGAMGLEALSRGAQYCAFVDKSPEACRVIRSNLEHLDVEKKRWSIYRQSVESFLTADLQRHISESFKLIFADPPYQMGFPDKAVEQLSRWTAFGSPALVVVETSAHNKVDPEDDRISGEKFDVVRDRTYGDTRIIMLRCKEKGGSSSGR